MHVLHASFVSLYPALMTRRYNTEVLVFVVNSNFQLFNACWPASYQMFQLNDTVLFLVNFRTAAAKEDLQLFYICSWASTFVFFEGEDDCHEQITSFGAYVWVVLRPSSLKLEVRFMEVAVAKTLPPPPPPIGAILHYFVCLTFRAICPAELLRFGPYRCIILKRFLQFFLRCAADHAFR